MYMAVLNGGATVSRDIDLFVIAFSAPKEEDKDKQRNFLIAVDILGIFFSVFSAPFFNNCKFFITHVM